MRSPSLFRVFTPSPFPEVEQGKQGELEGEMTDRRGTAKGNRGNRRWSDHDPCSPCSTYRFPLRREILLGVPPVPPVPPSGIQFSSEIENLTRPNGHWTARLSPTSPSLDSMVSLFAASAGEGFSSVLPSCATVSNRHRHSTHCSRSDQAEALVTRSVALRATHKAIPGPPYSSV